MKKHIFVVISLVVAVLVGACKEKEPVTLFMVGDSTMADKEDLEGSPERGWGQLFPTYLEGNIVVQNHARNGRSTKSFVDQGRWAEVMNRAKKGDILILQFGHNDAKIEDSTRYSTPEQYAENLRTMLTEAQAKGMDVILCTSVNRRHFKDGELENSLGEYPDMARKVAQEMEIPLLDLEKTTRAWLSQIGDEASKAYFMNVAPGECTKYPEGKIDDTHLREAGALEVGREAAELIKSQKIKFLSKYIRLDGEVRYSTPCGIE